MSLGTVIALVLAANAAVAGLALRLRYKRLRRDRAAMPTITRAEAQHSINRQRRAFLDYMNGPAL